MEAKMSRPFLFVALDDLNKKKHETLEIVEQLFMVDGNFGFKINLDYLLIGRELKKALYGFQSFHRQLRGFQRPLFTDLKLFNGSRTMGEIIECIVASEEVEYLSVHALADSLIPKAIKATRGTNTKVLGVTVLTHFGEDYCQEHFRRSLRETVRHFADVALERGCDGIILPGTTLDVVKDLDTIKVVPGVRPSWYQDKRHKEKVTPSEAIERGADILVCGSPIMKSSTPVEALKRVLQEMEGQLDLI